MKYKVNLDKVWNLPACRFSSCTIKDGIKSYCAIGKLIVGVFGESIFDENGKLKDEDYDHTFMRWIHTYIMSVGSDINDLAFHSGGHEKAIRLLLEQGLEQGVLELEDSDLELVRELKALQPV